MAYEQIQSGLSAEEERRKALRKQIIDALSGMGETQMVSGRAVPTSPLTGLSKIAQAIILKQGLGGSEEETKRLMKQQAEEKQGSVQNVMDIYQGRPEVAAQPQIGGPLEYGAGEEYQQFQPEIEGQAGIEADPMKAALMAASDPYTKDMSSILSSQLKGQGSTARPIATSSGYYGELPTGGYGPLLSESGEPLMPAYADPALQGKIVASKTQAKAEEERAFGMSGIGEAIQEAETILSGATGVMPTESGVGTAVDWAGGMVGMSPEGSMEAQKLKAIGGALTAKMPRMQGPQSDKDVQLYKEMAAVVGDSTIPADRRLAALQEVKRLWAKYERQQAPTSQTPKTGAFDEEKERRYQEWKARQ